MRTYDWIQSLRLIAVSTALLLALSGCQQPTDGSPGTDGQASEAGPDTTQQPPPTDRDPADGADSPQQSYDNQPPVDEPVLPLPDESGKGQGTGENVRPPADNVTAGVIEEKWNTGAPQLINLAIGESIAKANEQFGAASDTYTLKDGEEAITVSSYNGFSVGYGKDQQIRFIEVYESGVRTGLNGVRIGDFEDDVLEALGKPTTHTSYVIGYKAKGALLKFDMDPKSREILSIKLFSHA